MARRSDLGPAPPILSGASACAWFVRFYLDPIGCIARAARRFGPLAALDTPAIPGLKRLKARRSVLALGPEYNRLVLGDPERFRTTGQAISGPRDSAHRRLRMGLTQMNGERHAYQRQLLMPSFSKKAVEGYRARIIQITASLLAQWQAGQRVDMHQQMRAVTMRIAADVLFDPDPARSGAVSQMLEEWLVRSHTLGVMALQLDWPGLPYHRLMRHSERLEQVLLGMIRQRRSENWAQQDVLSVLVKGQRGKLGPDADRRLVGQAGVLFGASYETTATALTWTLFLLAQHPRVMHDALDELEGVLQGGPPTDQDLERLPLLDRVIQESMRVLPPVPFTIRGATGDVELAGIPLRVGDKVICSHYFTHHMPELFERPESFDPARWERIRPGPYEYLPFSAGPRMCIGYTFAMTAIKVVLSMLLPRFRVSVASGARIDRVVHVTMGPRGGMPMSIHQQDRQIAAAPVKGNIHEMVELPGAT